MSQTPSPIAPASNLNMELGTQETGDRNIQAVLPENKEEARGSEVYFLLCK